MEKSNRRKKLQNSEIIGTNQKHGSCAARPREREREREGEPVGQVGQTDHCWREEREKALEETGNCLPSGPLDGNRAAGSLFLDRDPLPRTQQQTRRIRRQRTPPAGHRMGNSLLATSTLPL